MKTLFIFIITIGIIGIGYYNRAILIHPTLERGDVIDSLNSVYVYYNGEVGNTSGRNVANNGYNLGLKYQCVEFVKRYYFEYYKHEMPDSYGHAKDFFQEGLKDGGLNKQRNLLQFKNSSEQKPKVGDILVFGPTIWNSYGHVAIVSALSNTEVEIIQQNAGVVGSSRENLKLIQENGKWRIDHKTIKGWLRRP